MAVQPPSLVTNAVKVALGIVYMGKVGSVCKRGDRRNEEPVITCRVQALAGLASATRGKSDTCW